MLPLDNSGSLSWSMTWNECMRIWNNMERVIEKKSRNIAQHNCPPVNTVPRTRGTIVTDERSRRCTALHDLAQGFSTWGHAPLWRHWRILGGIGEQWKIYTNLLVVKKIVVTNANAFCIISANSFLRWLTRNPNRPTEHGSMLKVIWGVHYRSSNETLKNLWKKNSANPLINIEYLRNKTKCCSLKF